MTKAQKELIGKEIKCLDKGFVRLIEVMGDDSSIVQAARVSYGKGTKSVREDRGLIRYLMRHRHTSPFEMVEFKFHVKLPIFVARQWIRHRTANVNEYSGRYSEMKDEFYVPDKSQVRHQSEVNKQGRGEELHESVVNDVISTIKSTQDDLFAKYEGFLETGMARELARINLPLSNYTEWYWKIDLHNLFHFLRLRKDAHAQYEIRVYADCIGEIAKEFAPVAYEAFSDYILDSREFSRSELKSMQILVKKGEIFDTDLKEAGLSSREAKEFFEKLEYMKGL